jgi:predicted Fe-Mo cluster-binding NifX family protein
MKIAISATGPGLDAEAEPRFGRCPCFILVDPETMEFEVMDNSSAVAAGGAGISAAQAIAGKGVQAVLTGNCGPNAYQALSAAGIEVITGISGKVKDAIEQYRSGKFKSSAQANVPDHFGAGTTPGIGGGFRMGGGRGRGRGLGRGMGGGPAVAPARPAMQQQSPDQELQELKNESQAMTQRLTDIQRRIEALEKK